jgi:hypothetical protein
VGGSHPEHLDFGVLVLQALLLRAIDPTGEIVARSCQGWKTKFTRHLRAYSAAPVLAESGSAMG